MTRRWALYGALALAALAAGLFSKSVGAHTPAPGSARAAPGNRPPELEPPPYGRVPPGKEIVFGLNVIDQDGDTVAVELVEKPASASYDPISLTVRWKPSAKDVPAGRFRVKITETQRDGGARRAFSHAFAIAVEPGAKPSSLAPPLGDAVELLLTIHDPERLAQVNKDWPLTRMLEVVRRVELAKLPEAERTKVIAPDGKELYADTLAMIALRSGHPRANPKAKEFDKKGFGDPAAWKITAVRPRLDKNAQELRIVYENVRVPEPVYLMFRFRLVRDLPPGELPPEALDWNNKEFTRLSYEAFFKGTELNPAFVKDKKAHAKAVGGFVAAVLDYKSDKFPQMGTEFMALPHEARLGGGSARNADGSYASGDGWYWAVFKAKWTPAAEGKPSRLTVVSVPIPGFTTEVRASADKSKWQTVCAAAFDPDDKSHKPGWEALCRKKLGFTDLPATDAAGKVVSGAIDAANLYLDYKYKDMVATIDLRDPRRDLFEENGMTCSQCHVRDFANGDLRDAGLRDPKAGRLPKASPAMATTFFNLVPEETWRPFMVEFQQLQECLAKDAFRRYQGVETTLTCPLVAE